jgi:hypothetical protein
VGDAENKTEIYFTHDKRDEKGRIIQKLEQSRIVCVPATEAALGYAADLLLLDELAFYENGRYFYYQIAQPRTYTTKGQIKSFSNPNGQQGIYWEFWNDPDFTRFNFSFLDCPTNTKEEYENLKRKLTRSQFDSTVDSRFTTPEGGFFTDIEIKEMLDEGISNHLPLVTQPIFMAYDFAKVRDSTVLTMGIRAPSKYDKDVINLKVLYIKEYPQGTDYTEIVNEAKRIYNQYQHTGVGAVGFDASGVGKAVEEFFKERQIPVIPVDFNLQNKARIYTNFKLMAEQRRITMPHLEEAFYQLSQLRFKTSSRGYLMVHHENESDKDDIPDSVAILNEVAIFGQPTKVSMTFIGDDGETFINEETIEKDRKLKTVEFI